MSAKQEKRVAKLEQQVSTVLRELARVNARPGSPYSSRLGLFLGKTDAAHDKDASGTINLWDGPEGDETDTGNTIEDVWNHFSDLETGKWVVGASVRGRKWLIAGECDSGGGGVTDHGALTGLTDDDHSQYGFLAGRSGGQTLSGDTLTGGNLTLSSTAHATKGKLLFGTSAYDEANNRLGIGTASPAVPLSVVGAATITGVLTLGSGPTTVSDSTGKILSAALADATLVSLSAYNTNGILTQTAADTFTGRTITGTAQKITVTNGDGVSGNPTLTIASDYVGQASITTVGTITSGTWTGTAIAVANGGTGATDASGARTNLGLVIGTNVQAFDAQLSSLAALSYGSNAGKVIAVNSGETDFELVAGSSPPFDDATAILKDSADATKLLRFELNGFTTGTTRVLTPPNSNGTIALATGLSGGQTIYGGTSNGNDLHLRSNSADGLGRIQLENAAGVDIAADLTLSPGCNIVLQTSTGTKIGTGTTQKFSFWNATPVVQQVLATGASATVDNVISLLQTLGLCRQS